MKAIPYGAFELRCDVERDTIPVVRAGDAIEGKLESLLGSVRRVATEVNGCLKIEYFNPNIIKNLIESRRTLPYPGNSSEEVPFAYITLSQPRFIHPLYGQIDTIGVYVFTDDEGLRDKVNKTILDELFPESELEITFDKLCPKPQ